MMPFVPIVRVKDADAAIAAAVKAEHGYRHTAIIHTNNLETATRMARAMNTTLFIHNAASPASLGVGGPGYFSHTHCDSDGRGHYHAAHVYARTADGRRRRIDGSYRRHVSGAH